METAEQKEVELESEIVVIDLDDDDPRIQKKADTSFHNFFVLEEGYRCNCATKAQNPSWVNDPNPDMHLPGCPVRAGLVGGTGKPYMTYDTADGEPISCDGVFQHKRLTPHEALTVGVIKARMTGQTTLDYLYDTIAEKLAYCQVAIVKAPEWWDDYIAGRGPRRMDASILGMVYEHMRLWENSFRDKAVAKRRSRVAVNRPRQE